MALSAQLALVDLAHLLSRRHWNKDLHEAKMEELAVGLLAAAA